MDKKESFSAHINSGYACKGDSIIIGGAMLDGAPLGGDALVRIPLKTMNRHGLIAGATGTGKTKTLQVISEHLSEKGVPVLLMDVKGDLSGISKPGEEKPFITDRMAKIGVPYETRGYPVELMSISQQPGVRMRATISEFGPVLLSRILDLNDTQGGVLAVIFKYCDDHKMPLLDLKDLKKVIQFATDEGKTEIEREYGKVSAMSTGVILRKLLELEQQDADLFFGEMSFEIRDLMRKDSDGKGYINIIRLTDIQDRPKLFSTFMLCLLAEVYNEMPERGDLDKPELVIFIDEAHLIFREASKTLLNQIETIVKLIRSKGVGVFFVTQNPMDVPNEVLAQLGLKVQHALRAFTAIDRQAIKLTAENFPLSNWYKTDEVLTSLGTGEALVTALNEKGIPTPLAVAMVRAPQSRMDILSPEEIESINRSSQLVSKYNQVIDRESAWEMLTDKIDTAGKRAAEEAERRQAEKGRKTTGTTRRRAGVNPVVKVLTSATFIRGVLGIMKKVIK
jgi:DNA helicase HerA-like ATPase